MASNKYQQRGGQRGSQRGGQRDGGHVDMREEDFARPSSEQTVVQPQMCTQCHDEPVLRVVVQAANGRTYENFFYGDARNQLDPLGDNCARQKVMDIVQAETGRLEHIIGVLQGDLPDYDTSRIESTIGDKLAEIEEELIPNVKYGEAIATVRSLRRVTNLSCAEALLVRALKLAEPHRDIPDAKTLITRIQSLEKERVGMMPDRNGYFPKPEDGGARPGRDEFAIFADAQRVRVQAANIGQQQQQRQEAEQRRERVREEVRGQFSSRFRRSASAATSDESDDVPGTLANDPENAAKLASVKGQLHDDEPDSVPADLSADAETQVSTDETEPVETDTPAAVENA